MLQLYTPQKNELWFKRTMMQDAATMAYNAAWGGTIPFPESRWDIWYDKWILHSDGSRFYRYLQEPTGAFVGEIAYHWDEEQQIYLADVVIYAPFRHRGYGRQGLRLLCAAAKENGISALYDAIVPDNPAVQLFLQEGFSEERQTEEAILVKKEL